MQMEKPGLHCQWRQGQDWDEIPGGLTPTPRLPHLLAISPDWWGQSRATEVGAEGQAAGHNPFQFLNNQLCLRVAPVPKHHLGSCIPEEIATNTSGVLTNGKRCTRSEGSCKGHGGEQCSNLSLSLSLTLSLSLSLPLFLSLSVFNHLKAPGLAEQLRDN